MRTETPPKVHLKDYQPFPFRVERVRLLFNLYPSATTVVSRLTMTRTSDSSDPLRLDGEKITLKRIELNGRPLSGDEFVVDGDGLTIPNPGDAFDLEIETEICPKDNTELSGLYISTDRFCTQCEAEGFRRITYYPDRPDVLAPFFVRIEADKEKYPRLLSNGNPGDAGDLPGGRHFAEWNDPHPKPSYLFALVGGEFDVLDDHFTTMSGRRVHLTINVEKGDAPRAAYAMQSLKKAMAWDEDVFGREYDLDVFQIVAVRDFNFGAMENKGLNIFNAAYVLADGETATDADFEAIESIVAHEYFHNWTGNRITCRDWFQLCLKEGLTVYRDQEFSKAMRSPAVSRIKDVIRLRTRQFPEDAGPLAHPVRPDSYARIDNLYTATVYEKGSELIRMLRTLIGNEAFFAGLNRYFDQLDGQAATIEQFLDSFQPSTTRNLAEFSRWYAQAGTPQVKATGNYDPDTRTYRLSLSQTTAPTPGQNEKSPMVLPMRVALFDANGAKMETQFNAMTAAEHLLVLESASSEYVFSEVSSAPYPSLNRGFSAPIRLTDDLGEAARAALAGADDDAFAQWEGLQSIARALILDAAGSGDEEPDPARLDAFLTATRDAVARAVDDPAYAALLLYLPTVGELILDMKDADPDAIHVARLGVRRAVARRLEEQLVAAAEQKESGAFDASAASAGRRALKSAALSLLSSLGKSHQDRIVRALDAATTMTERLGALGALSNIDSGAFDRALGSFEARWSGLPLVMDKWFGVQAMAVRTDLRDRLQRLSARADYDLKNPNRVRSLAASFSMNNPVGFHAADGWGYRFLGDLILKVDPLNPALSARLLTSFESWRAFNATRRDKAQAELGRLSEADLSKNARDIISRALADRE
ncbi:MAG: aminopeptidase N [Alphaproteobacteria bacterium]|nr:aminopeptidase N [Alphaproteobacteria bacterium]